MGKPNPKIHDALFKWLITSFTREFFAHYFPTIRIGSHRFLDKEFVSRYEALRESLKGDLFLAMETETDGQLREIVIQIEHMSDRKDVSERVYRYSCYAWLLREKPVWSIVIYTDDAVWRKPVPGAFWYAFDSRNGKQFHHFDIIKVKAEKSADLIKKHSLLCKLLALKADDSGTESEALLREIYRAVSEMKEGLSEDQLLLVDQWTDAYKKVTEQELVEIRKEADMAFVATTISEHIRHEAELKGRIEGEIEGKIKGEIEGKIKGKIELIENLFLQGVLSKEQCEEMAAPLRRELAELMAGEERDGLSPKQ